MERLARKYQTAKKFVPQSFTREESGAEIGIVAYGSTDLAMKESQDMLKVQGLKTNYLRLKSLPFGKEVEEFYKKNKRIYVVEQNRDGQMARILNSDLGAEAALKTRSVKYFDGLPIDASSIASAILTQERGR
jgi:2-oxoglutarate ferredoxin oxidoreductase subunit alpha